MTSPSRPPEALTAVAEYRETRAALLRESVLELRAMRGRLSKVSVEDFAVMLDILDRPSADPDDDAAILARFADRYLDGPALDRDRAARAGEGLLREAAEQAFHYFVMTAGEYFNHYGHNDEPINELRAALADSPMTEPSGLDVKRLAEAITYHSVAQRVNGPDAYLGHKCMGDCAADIAAEYAALADPRPAGEETA